MQVMSEFNNENKYQILKRSLEIQLIKYLNKYLKKNFNMELVFHTIKKTLKKKEEITEKPPVNLPKSVSIPHNAIKNLG